MQQQTGGAGQDWLTAAVAPFYVCTFWSGMLSSNPKTKRSMCWRMQNVWIVSKNIKCTFICWKNHRFSWNLTLITLHFTCRKQFRHYYWQQSSFLMWWSSFSLRNWKKISFKSSWRKRWNHKNNCSRDSSPHQAGTKILLRLNFSDSTTNKLFLWHSAGFKRHKHWISCLNKSFSNHNSLYFKPDWNLYEHLQGFT